MDGFIIDAVFSIMLNQCNIKAFAILMALTAPTMVSHAITVVFK
ncbi:MULTISPECIES: hypothetical protein [unclassified Vibrio]|nr:MULTISPECIES: hypothetical protein [unclassified Vibrio]